MVEIEGTIHERLDVLTLAEMSEVLGVSKPVCNLVRNGVKPGRNALRKMRAVMESKDYKDLVDSLR